MAMKKFWRENSLSIVLFGLFIFSFVMHGISGAASYNEQALQHC